MNDVLIERERCATYLEKRAALCRRMAGSVKFAGDRWATARAEFEAIAAQLLVGADAIRTGSHVDFGVGDAFS